MKSPAFISLSLYLSALCGGCTVHTTQPTQQPEPQEVAPEGNGPGHIPWAEGDKPLNAEDTTREVGPQPKSQEIHIKDYGNDGVGQMGPTNACMGKVSAALRVAVQERAEATLVCYDKVPAEKAGQKGDVKFGLRLSEDGSVHSTKLIKDSFGVPETTTCIEKVLNKTFAAGPSGGCAVFVIPVHLEAEQVEAHVEEEAASE